MSAVDVDAVGARVEQLLDEIAAADPIAAGAAEALVSELLGLYGAALERLVGVLRDAAPAALGSLAADPLVGGLLALHDLHPVEVRARVEGALEAYAGTVALIDVAGGAVRVRVDAAGCGSAGLLARVERDIQAAAPEVTEVAVVEAGAHEGHGLIAPDALLVRPAWAGA